MIGLASSLPLVWGESGDIRGQLAGAAAPHWAMAVLNARGRVVPLDTLAGAQGLALPADALLVLAQPRPLSPDENVALDAWVRSGGRLLLLADPMLTAHSAFALGDPRRPETIVMVSPILRHWGLELQFDPEQPDAEQRVNVFGTMLPVRLAGSFSVAPQARCRLSAAAHAADCAIGKGRVIAVADAALLDQEHEDERDGDNAGRVAALGSLLDLLSR